MSLKIRTIGNPDLIGDIQPGWSIDENATPHAIGDGSASVGGVQFSAGRRDDSEFLLNKPVTVYYEPEGTVATGNNVTGVFDSVDTSGGSAGVTSTNLLSKLTAETSMRPSFPLTDKLYVTSAPRNNPAEVGDNPRFDPVRNMIATISRGDGVTIPTTGTRIKYYSNSGVLLTWTNLIGGPLIEDYNTPFAIDDTGRFYIYDRANKAILVYTNAGAYVTSWATSTTTNQPSVIKYNKYDNTIWIVDNLYRVRSFNKAGTVTRTWITYNNLFTASTSLGTGVTCNDIAFLPDSVHCALSNGVFAYSISGTPLFYSLYPEPESVFAKSLEFDSYGNYLLYAFGYLYSMAVRGPILSQSALMVASTAARPQRGLAVNEDGHAVVLSLPDISTSGLHIFSSSPTSVRGYTLAVLDKVLGSVSNVTYSGSNQSVVFPGWTDSTWTKLNELCAATGKEIVLQNDTIIVRDVASANITLDNFVGSPQRSAEKGSGRHIEIVNQNTSVVSNSPVFDYTVDAGRAISADLNEYNVTNVRLNTWLTSIQSPTPVDGVIGVYTPPGTYMVFSQENFPVPASTWKQYGGSFSATVGADGQSIDFAMRGPSVPIGGYTAPFSISAVLGGSKVTGVSVLGSGVMTNPIPVTVATGADWSIVTQDIAQTINQPFITSLGVLFDRAEFACAASNGGGQVLDITVPTSDIGGLGLTAGSMFQYGKTVWRVRSSKIGNATINIKADSLTSVGQHDSVVPGETIGQHDARLAALTLGDSALKPLY